MRLGTQGYEDQLNFYESVWSEIRDRGNVMRGTGMRYVTKGMLCKGTGHVSSSITHRCTLEKYCLHGLREDIYQSNDKRNVKGLMINGVHGQAQHKAYL